MADVPRWTVADAAGKLADQLAPRIAVDGGPVTVSGGGAHATLTFPHRHGGVVQLRAPLPTEVGAVAADDLAAVARGEGSDVVAAPAFAPVNGEDIREVLSRLLAVAATDPHTTEHLIQVSAGGVAATDGYMMLAARVGVDPHVHGHVRATQLRSALTTLPPRVAVEARPDGDGTLRLGGADDYGEWVVELPLTHDGWPSWDWLRRDGTPRGQVSGAETIADLLHSGTAVLYSHNGKLRVSMPDRDDLDQPYLGEETSLRAGKAWPPTAVDGARLRWMLDQCAAPAQLRVHGDVHPIEVDDGYLLSLIRPREP